MSIEGRTGCEILWPSCSALSSRAPAAPLAVKGEAIMTNSHDHKPINFVGLYFIDEERDETGQIIAQISDGYYLAQFDPIEKGAPPPRLEVLSSAEFTNSAKLWLATLAILCRC